VRSSGVDLLVVDRVEGVCPRVVAAEVEAATGDALDRVHRPGACGGIADERRRDPVGHRVAERKRVRGHEQRPHHDGDDRDERGALGRHPSMSAQAGRERRLFLQLARV
jgi:hypothetical protein